MSSSVIAYPLHDGLYLNITNRCPNACVFCIRNTERGVGYDLWLEREPTITEILAAIGELQCYREVIFCGYGEPLIRPEIVVAVSSVIKERIRREQLNLKIRLNTNGLADLFLDHDILPQLVGLIDTISISLNAHNAQEYLKLTGTQYGEKAFTAVLTFTKRSILYIPKVILSVVNYPGVDIPKAQDIADGLGVELRVRECQM